MIRRAIACLAVACIAVPAYSQPPPTIEPLEPDRPDVTNGTHIIDIGLLQVEIGGLYTRNGPSQTAFGSPFTARVGLTEWLEARFGTDGLVSETDIDGRATGIGNLQLGAKLRLWADPGGVPVLSILPTVNIPTASAEKGLGSGEADYAIVLLTGTDIGGRGHVDVNYGIGAIGAGGGRPHFTQHLASVSASVSASSHWNPYAEGFWFSKQDADGGAMAALDAGAVYVVSPQLAIDGGVQVGISQAAPDVAFFAGLSIIVGDVLGGHGVHQRQRRAETRAVRRAPATHH